VSYSHSISLETRSSVSVRLPGVAQCLLEVVLVDGSSSDSSGEVQRVGEEEASWKVLLPPFRCSLKPFLMVRRRNPPELHFLISPLKFILSKMSSYTTLTSCMSLVLLSMLYHGGD